jgi:hypothetical protein
VIVFYRTVRFFRRRLGYFLILVLMIFGLQYSSLPLGLQWNAVALAVRDYQFDYVAWEANAIVAKAGQALFGLQPFMNEADRSQYVRNYMADLAEAQSLEAQVSAIFTDPAVTNPEAASADLRAQRAQLRADLRTRQTLAESILEGQVAAVLTEQDFGTLGQLLPPISMRFTQVPNLLIVSPRDEIRFDISINIIPLPVDQIDTIERQIDQQEKVSSLIVPLGGIALFPAMILETSSIPRALDTFSHEWLHHYLFAFPLGFNYDFAGETRIINETTASVFGQKIAPLVLQRYYPELAPQPTPPNQPPPPTPEPAAFDFGREMDITRRRVDDLLAQGKVEEAEAYMEERREFFYANGYLIRKINQAFFAFYGGYQSGSGMAGTGGADLIGESVQGIFDESPSIQDAIVTLRDVVTREELVAAYDQFQIDRSRK